MDVQIHELTTQIDVVDDRALFSPEVFEQIVRMVMRHLEDAQRSKEMLDADRDMRSIVDQQRAGKR
jgi:hypothetical protein